MGGLKNREKKNHDRLIAATVATMPLLMPFYFDYDLLLLAVPATLYAVDRMRNGETNSRAELWLMRSWSVLFFWLFFNPAVAFHSHVNVTVLLLSAVAGQLIWRAGRNDAAVAIESDWQEPTYSIAA